MNIIMYDPDGPKNDFLDNIFGKEDYVYCILDSQSFLEYIKDTVIANQLHIDLIITEYYSYGIPVPEIIDFIRSSDATYSDNNFKLSSIPILIYTRQNPQIDYKNLKVNLTLDKGHRDHRSRLVKNAKTLVVDWRRKIYDDLELLGVGVDYNFDRINMGYAVTVKSDNTFILSKSFLIKQKRLPYLWLKADFFEQEKSLNDLEKLINQYLEYPREKLQRYQWEEQFQQFFKLHPEFLFEKNYNRYWSQPKLKIGDTKRSYKPDFIKEPRIGMELSKNWEIVDLKLPLMEFMQQTSFHPTFTAKFLKCLKQIKDYKTYFMNDQNKTNIEEVLKFHPKHPKLTLLVGKRNTLYNQQDLLHQNLNELNFADVSLMAYDEIVDRQKNKIEELMEMKL